MSTQAFTNDGHHWSGWPGAHCYKCGTEDPDEIALADGKWWPDAEGKIAWKSEKDRLEVEKLTVCRVKGVLKWNNAKGKFDLITAGGTPK